MQFQHICRSVSREMTTKAPIPQISRGTSSDRSTGHLQGRVSGPTGRLLWSACNGSRQESNMVLYLKLVKSITSAMAWLAAARLPTADSQVSRSAAQAWSLQAFCIQRSLHHVSEIVYIYCAAVVAPQSFMGVAACGRVQHQKLQGPMGSL